MFELTPLQLSRLGREIASTPGAPAEIELSEEEDELGNTCPSFVSKSLPGFFFTIDEFHRSPYDLPRRTRGGLAVRFAPNKDGVVGKGLGISWEDVEQEFMNWVSRVVENVKAPNYWAILGQAQSDKVSAVDASDDVPFGRTEAEELRAELRGIEERAAERYKLDAAELTSLKNELAKLREDLDGMKRGRWRRLFYGTMAKMAMERVIEAPIVQQVAKDIAEAVAHHFPSNLLLPGL